MLEVIVCFDLGLSWHPEMSLKCMFKNVWNKQIKEDYTHTNINYYW